MLGLLIGRFQPPHIGHIELIRMALTQCDQLLILLGCTENKERTRKNPFTWSERAQMIRDSLTQQDCERLIITPLSDTTSDQQWCDTIKEEVASTIHKKINIHAHAPGDYTESVKLFGCNKDASSIYLQWFPEYTYSVLEQTLFDGLSSTPLRELYLDTGIISMDKLPPGTIAFLQDPSRDIVL